MPPRKSLTRYRIRLNDITDSDPHFEIRLNDENRMLHVAFRARTGLVAMNSMVGGVWGAEQSFQIDDREAFRQPIHVDTLSGLAKVQLGSQSALFNMETRFAGTSSPRLAAKNAVCERLALNASDEAILDDADSAIVGLSICGNPVVVPPQDRLELFSLALESSFHRAPYLSFVGSRLFPDRMVVLDLARDSAYCALAHALLFPGSTVYRLSRDQAESDVLSRLCSINAVTNLQSVPFEDMETLLRGENPAEILLQGDDIFASCGELLAKLPAARRERVHVYSREGAVVPADVVFPHEGQNRTNIQISVGKHWALNHHAATAATGRRVGLDVVVAAYDAKEYLEHCVESLLPAGREDVRVIVVDDGSTDGCGEVVAERFRDEARVKVLGKPNGGCASARNFGRLDSTATHIAFVDADDFVDPGFFADLFDLALYSGAEIVQGGFDFFDESLPTPYYASYEDSFFADRPRLQFGPHEVLRINAMELIKTQPTIWRKVYRRDFLDARNIYFPENIRAYDDYIFQMFALTAARDLIMMPEQRYHYRQHPRQDIKQGDDRHFYMIHMFQMALRRSVEEGWPDFAPYCESILASIDWSLKKLRPDLVESFLKSSASLCVAVSKVYGDAVLPDSLIDQVSHPDFRYWFERAKAEVAQVPPGVHWSFFSAPIQHPDILRMRSMLQKSV